MDYIKELRAFQNFMIKNDLPKGAITLWYTLMNIKMTEGEECNWLSVPNKTIECLAGLSRQGVINARESLKQCGLIDFVEGEGRKRSPQYQLLSLAEEMTEEVNENIVVSNHNTSNENNEEVVEEQAETQEREVSSTDVQKEFETVWTFCENNFEHLHHHFKYDIKQWLAVFNSNLMIEAFSRAKNLHKPYGYGVAILKNWKKKHVKTMDEVKKLDAAFEQQQREKYGEISKKHMAPFNRSKKGHKPKIERIPEWHNEPDPPAPANWEEQKRMIEERIRNL